MPPPVPAGPGTPPAPRHCPRPRVPAGSVLVSPSPPCPRRAPCAHLVGGHLADRPVGLEGLQLLQAPVQLLQRLPRQLLGRLLWGQRTAPAGTPGTGDSEGDPGMGLGDPRDRGEPQQWGGPLRLADVGTPRTGDCGDPSGMGDVGIPWSCGVLQDLRDVGGPQCSVFGGGGGGCHSHASVSPVGPQKPPKAPTPPYLRAWPCRGGAGSRWATAWGGAGGSGLAGTPNFGRGGQGQRSRSPTCCPGAS